MTQNPANYLQNYQNYYQSTQEPYEDYYDDENQDLKVNYDEGPPDLQVPNSRLYAEGFPEVTELYAGNGQFTESQQQVDNTGMLFRHEYNPGPHDYCYNVTQPQHHQHRTRVPKTQPTTLQSTSSFRYSRPHSLYSSCPLATSHSLQGPALKVEGSCYVPKRGVNTLHGMGRNIPHSIANTNVLQGVGENYNFPASYSSPVDDQEKYEDFDQSQRRGYSSQENYGDYCTGTRARYMEPYGGNQEMFMDYKGKRFSYYGNRIVGKSGVMKKYPVTVKTPKYVTKNQAVPPIHKRPSALCLPVVTQPDPGLVKRKSKTHHQIKKIYDKSEPLSQNTADATENYSYSAHQMHSEGDMSQKSVGPGLENLLDQFENKVVLNESEDTGEGEQRGGVEAGENRIKEFTKFLKPRVPSSIKAKQERIAKMKSSMNMSGIPLQPKMKLSLDKLLNRLQKCEKSESGEKLSEKSSQSQKEVEEQGKNIERKNNQHRSFNYDSLTRKLSPRVKDADGPEQPKNLLSKASTSLTTSLDNKKSSRLIRPLDDHCAIDLHRSKSYIVDLIDRALSKELGTVPRGQSAKNDMTPKRAVTTISRHRQSRHNDLCYEVTAALTDSFISNVTAPPKQDGDRSLKRSENDDCDNKKLCKSLSDDVNYIKQLKQLRWGHIMHIQHEARKLADLEEFLEKCGEVEY